MVRLLLVLALSSSCLVAPAFSLEPDRANLSAKTLDRWLRYILPKSDELSWQSIPWRAGYWDAIIEGQEEERPILLWAMNGHPLGCT